MIDVYMLQLVVLGDEQKRFLKSKGMFSQKKKYYQGGAANGITGACFGSTWLLPRRKSGLLAYPGWNMAQYDTLLLQLLVTRFSRSPLMSVRACTQLARLDKEKNMKS